MKRLMAMLLLIFLVLFLAACGEYNDTETGNGEDNSSGEQVPEEENDEEPAEELEGLDFIVDAIEENFTVTALDPIPYESLGAVKGVEIRIGRDTVELYEFDPDGNSGEETIEDAETTGNINRGAERVSAVFNENHNVMLVNYENHPMGIEIKEMFEEL